MITSATDTAGIPAGTPVLVTGATGFTGSVLTRKLAGMGLRLRAIARHSSRVDALRDLDIHWFRGDVFDPRVVREAAADVEYIFHVAAAFREARHPDEFYHKVHVESTQLLADAATKSPRFRRFVHVSTIGVHGHIDEPPANEEYRFSPGDIYQKTKAEAELWLREHAPQVNLSFTVIRPAAIYGPGDRRLLKLFRMATWPVFPILGHGKCLYHLIHVDDLTDAMIRAATHPAAEGEAFIIGNAEPIPLVTLAGIVAEEVGGRLRVVRIPVGPFFVLGGVCEAVCRPLGVEPPIHRRRVAFYTKDRAFDTRKMREKLGYTCRIGYEEGIRATARWYVEQGWMRRRAD